MPALYQLSHLALCWPFPYTLNQRMAYSQGSWLQVIIQPGKLQSGDHLKRIRFLFCIWPYDCKIILIKYKGPIRGIFMLFCVWIILCSGQVSSRTHTPAKIVNKESRFHKSAGLDELVDPGRGSPVQGLSESPTSSGELSRLLCIVLESFSVEFLWLALCEQGPVS